MWKYLSVIEYFDSSSVFKLIEHRFLKIILFNFEINNT